MRVHYDGTDDDLQMITKLIFKVWVVLAISLLATPFLGAIIDSIMGRFSIKSWKLLHNSTL